MVHLALTTFALVSVLSSSTEAHQVVRNPAPIYRPGTDGNKMNPIAYLEGQNIQLGPSFNDWRKKNNYNTLRAFMDDQKRYKVVPGADFNCGWTDIRGKAQPIPKDGGMTVSGYTHNGMCEVWVDNKIVAQGNNCHSDFPDRKHCIDYSSCKGNCVMHWYWLAERFLKGKYSWQVYKACIPLTSGGKPVNPPNCKQKGAAPSSPNPAPSPGSQSPGNPPQSPGSQFSGKVGPPPQGKKWM